MPDTPDLSPDAAEGRDQERSTRKEPAKQTAREKATQAAQLRVAGFSYAEIAKRLGYANEGGAWKACERARKGALREAGSQLVDLELTRYDTLQRAAMTKALRGDAPSIRVALRVMEQRAKLLGLYEVRGEERIGDFRDAFAVFLGQNAAAHPDPEPDPVDDDQEPAA